MLSIDAVTGNLGEYSAGAHYSNYGSSSKPAFKGLDYGVVDAFTRLQRYANRVIEGLAKVHGKNLGQYRLAEDGTIGNATAATVDVLMKDSAVNAAAAKPDVLKGLAWTPDQTARYAAELWNFLKKVSDSLSAQAAQYASTGTPTPQAPSAPPAPAPPPGSTPAPGYQYATYQTMAPAPGQAPAVGPAPAKKNRTWIWVAAGIGGVAVLGAVAIAVARR